MVTAKRVEQLAGEFYHLVRWMRGGKAHDPFLQIDDEESGFRVELGNGHGVLPMWVMIAVACGSGAIDGGQDSRRSGIDESFQQLDGARELALLGGRQRFPDGFEQPAFAGDAA